MAGSKYPVRFSDPGTGQRSRFAGLPVGVEFNTRYYVFDPFALISDTTVPNATAATPGLDWTTTAVGSSTFSATDDRVPPAVNVTTGANDNDGAQAQYTAASGSGEFFDLRATKKRYFGCRFSLSDANNDINTVQQCDIFLGLCITDTTILGGATDFIGFHKIDGSGDVNFVAGTGASTSGLLTDQIVQSTGITLTAADAGAVNSPGNTAQVGAMHSFEFITYGSTQVEVYADGLWRASVRSSTQLPIGASSQLCPSIAFLTGEAVLKLLSIQKFIVAVEY